ncbi:MAG TPA: hypothetical protein DEO59_02755 [Balneola sp.]|nr:hypothetical protein [Balneola sp.]
MHKPKGVQKPVYPTYTKPKPVVKKYPTYTKPKSIKYNHVKSQPTRPIKNYPQYTKPKSIQRPVKITPQKKIQHVQKQNRKI